MIIKRNKIKEDKRKEEEWYQGGMFGGDEKVKRRRKVGQSVNVKKKWVQFDEHNKKITFFVF